MRFAKVAASSVVAWTASMGLACGSSDTPGLDSPGLDSRDASPSSSPSGSPSGSGSPAGSGRTSGSGSLSDAASGSDSRNTSGSANGNLSGAVHPSGSGDASVTASAEAGLDGGGSNEAGVDANASPEAGSGPAMAPPPAVLPVPSSDQLAWQRLEWTAFLHFGTNTFDGTEQGNPVTTPAIFNPTALDAKQWVATLKGAGFTQATLTVKHADGFCLWPSQYTSFSVKSSPWKGGQGDVVREFSDAARAANMRIGLYYGPWDTHETTYGTPAYDTFFRNQLTELLSQYGPVAEVWFDGGKATNSGVDWNAVVALIKRLQPHALVFMGPQLAALTTAPTLPTIRWIGNEQGMGAPNQSSVQMLNGQTLWYPSEADVSIRGASWYWHPNQDGQVMTLGALQALYLRSVGRNSVALLNVPPAQTGQLAAPDVTVLGQFGAWYKSLYKQNLVLGQAATASSVWRHAPDYGAAKAVDADIGTFWAAADATSPARLEVDLPAAVNFNLISVREPIELGERTTKYHVEIQQGGAWTTIATGQVIGERNLLQVGATTAQKIALVIEQARGIPAISEFEIYQAP